MSRERWTRTKRAVYEPIPHILGEIKKPRNLASFSTSIAEPFSVFCTLSLQSPIPDPHLLLAVYYRHLPPPPPRSSIIECYSFLSRLHLVNHPLLECLPVLCSPLLPSILWYFNGYKIQFLLPNNFCSHSQNRPIHRFLLFLTNNRL